MKSEPSFSLILLFQQYGDIRALYTACKHRGFVMISYYDIRSARNAMCSLQNKPLRRRKLDIHYSIPKVPAGISSIRDLSELLLHAWTDLYLSHDLNIN
jgi:RNA recognition motif. (a.k.a. RRM, RBD, or RNP domain)